VKSYDQKYLEWRAQSMGKVFEWVRLGLGKRLVQLRGTQEAGFVADAIEMDPARAEGVVIATGKGKSGDTALIQMSIDLRVKTERPTGSEASAS